MFYIEELLNLIKKPNLPFCVQFMVQCTLSRLKLTKIVTVLPLFVVVNQLTRPIRYMEENHNTDLWLDLAPDQVGACWGLLYMPAHLWAKYCLEFLLGLLLRIFALIDQF